MMSDNSNTNSSKEEQQADRLEQALDELDAGVSEEDVADELDSGLSALFSVATRLRRSLPGDLPDPAFRRQLGEDLLAADPPVNLSARRGRRFLFDWRFGVAAAALAAILLIAVIYGSGTLMGNSPEPPARETVVSALSVAKETPQPGATTTPVIVTNTQVLPPIDTDHVVMVPLGLGAGGVARGTPEPQPTAGIALTASLPALPQTAKTWLLTGPTSSQEFLHTLMARIGINGQIQPAPNEGTNAFVVADSTGFKAIHWDQHNDFFRYDRGPDEPTPPAARATADPAVTATDWLHEIGFDLTTIKYTTTVHSDNDQTVIRFDPAELPETAIPPGLGVTVGVGPDGSIQFAQGFWLSLKESADVPMRTCQEAFDAAQAGEWYSVMPAGVTPEMSMNVSAARMSYLLTRADDSSFLLQPVVTFSGERWTPQGDVQDSIYVSAIKK